MSCPHDQEDRTEVQMLCNIRHDAQNKHKPCESEYCNWMRCNCPHIFGYQKCSCGKEFVGELGVNYKEDDLIGENK